jgi:hypothetical protein
MKKLIPLILLLFFGNGVAEDTLLCITDKTAGFGYENGTWAVQYSEDGNKFKYVFKGSLGKTPVDKSYGVWYRFGSEASVSKHNCSGTRTVVCNTLYGEFKLNKDNLRFEGSFTGAYINDIHDWSNFVQIGKCSKL